jgi:allantoinase
MRPSDYGPFPYAPIIDRPRLRWPNDARVALWICPNVEFFSLSDTIPVAGGGNGVPAPDVPAWSVRDYGNRIGIFRLMDVLDSHKIRATVALNANLCAQHPKIITEGLARGWEFMGHGETNSRRLNTVPPEEEQGIIHRAFAKIEAATGVRPKGWLSSALQETWQTLDYLVAEGCEYVCDWTNDDQPVVMELEQGRRLVSLPYSYEVNDKPSYERYYRSPAEFRDMICRAFDVLYEEGATSGRVMVVAVHPYLTGMAHRIRAFDAALDYICKHEHVWLATGSEIVEHYLKNAK